MHIVAVLNLKGGCGKTTICLNLAAALGERGRRAIVIDLDPQRSATRWASQAGQAPQSDAPGFDLRTAVTPLRVDRGGVPRFQADLARAGQQAGADVAILDCPPELKDPALVAALLAELVLAPVSPSPLDFWAAEVAVATARDARKERGGRLPLISLVPSRLISGTVLAREIAGTLASLGEPVAPGIAQRVALVEAAVAGQTIDAYAPHSPAHDEFLELAKHVLGRLKGVKT